MYQILRTNSDLISPTTAVAAQLNDNTTLSDHDNHEVYNVLCSLNPFEDCETIAILICGKHENNAPYLHNVKYSKMESAS